jgi:hypothetical protein
MVKLSFNSTEVSISQQLTLLQNGSLGFREDGNTNSMTVWFLILTPSAVNEGRKIGFARQIHIINNHTSNCLISTLL